MDAMKSVKDINVSGKRVLVRVDYNLPMDDQGNISDDNRIRATLPLIQYLIEREAKVILISHMGRPGGKVVPNLTLAPAAARLSQLIGQDVRFVSDCVGDAVSRSIDELASGDVALLENLRFHGGEKSNDPGFAQALASLCDIYVNDAFAVSHRKQASVVALPERVPLAVAGFLLEKELQCYRDAVQNPKRPLVAVIGGAKVSSKLEALRNMIDHVDTLIIGGAMANTFLTADGYDLGGSMVEADLMGAARDIVSKASQKGVSLELPVDLVVASRLDNDAETKMIDLSTESVPHGWMALDIGKRSVAQFAKRIEKAATIVWNGPMGVFEMPRFLDGTQAIADAIAGARDAFSIIGGGDTGRAAVVCNVADKVGYISTGGGAFLHLMEGKTLPGVDALK